MAGNSRVSTVIVISQFCCTSLWFATNGVMNDLVSNFQLSNSAIGHLTSSVQIGFITGTLLFALFNVPDRFSPSRVFLLSAIAGALFNVLVLLDMNTFGSLISLRFVTGVCLAGIYPVGMKIAADYQKEGLGFLLSFLVGALVLGTAFPHLLKGYGSALPWKGVIVTTSVLAGFGGSLMWALVPDGPFRKPGMKLDPGAIGKVFRRADFRSAAFGYFGHMWELYAFWAFVPVILATYQSIHPGVHFNLPLWSFVIIGIGGPACVFGGYLSRSLGTKRVAFLALLASGACCFLSPFLFQVGSEYVFIAFLIFWGMAVIADSPLFSTLVAHNATPEIKGTALTIVNSIGFAITILSIQLITALTGDGSQTWIYLVLGIGPVLGLLALGRKTLT